MKIIQILIYSLSLLASIDQAAFGQSCPPHAHVTGTMIEGNVKTIHCGCDSDYTNVDGRCTSRTECVSDAGYQLKFALRDCQADRPPLVSFACLRGTGITSKSLACLQGLPGAQKNKLAALAKCSLLGTVPLDAAVRCQDIHDQCIVAALQAHKSRIAACRK